jgi:hypothetical protein
MNLITIDMLVQTAHERWKSQYFYGGKWGKVSSGPCDKIYDKLLKCKTKEEVDSAIGNKTWTVLTCSCCDCDVKELVSFYDNDDRSFSVCFKCLNAAKKLKPKKGTK